MGVGSLADTLTSLLTVCAVGDLPATRFPIVVGDSLANLLKAYLCIPLACSQSLKFDIFFFSIYALIIIAVMNIVNGKREEYARN